LVLGILKQKCYAEEILRQYGVIRETVEKIDLKPPRIYEPTIPRQPRARPSNIVEIHGAQWSAEYIHDRVKSCSEIFWHWQKQSLKSRDIVVHRVDGRISFDLTLADASQDYEVVAAGWKKDHCIVCHWELLESSDDPAHGVGYSNGRDWLCAECFEKFCASPHFFTSNYPEIM